MKQYISPQLLQTAQQLRDQIIALRPFPEETLKSLREYYRIGLTYSSNALEGNSLTESETKVVIEIATQMDLLRLLTDGGVNGGANRDTSNKNGGINIENLILEVIQNKLGINAPAIANTLQKSLRTTQRYIKLLSDAGKIEFRGATKNGGYYII